MDHLFKEIGMIDASVQMTLDHFIATRRPNGDGWDKEVAEGIEKGMEVFTTEGPRHVTWVRIHLYRCAVVSVVLSDPDVTLFVADRADAALFVVLFGDVTRRVRAASDLAMLTRSSATEDAGDVTEDAGSSADLAPRHPLTRSLEKIYRMLTDKLFREICLFINTCLQCEPLKSKNT